MGKSGLLAVGEGGSFFCVVLSHVASVVKKEGTDRRVSPCCGIIARMFLGVKRTVVGSLGDSWSMCSWAGNVVAR